MTPTIAIPRPLPPGGRRACRWAGAWALGVLLGWATSGFLRAADPAPAVPAPRLAVGALGLGDPARETQLADLVLAELSTVSEVALVERTELRKVLQELQLNP